jgi:hypothetical protein
VRTRAPATASSALPTQLRGVLPIQDRLGHQEGEFASYPYVSGSNSGQSCAGAANHRRRQELPATGFSVRFRQGSSSNTLLRSPFVDATAPCPIKVLGTHLPFQQSILHDAGHGIFYEQADWGTSVQVPRMALPIVWTLAASAFPVSSQSQNMREFEFLYPADTLCITSTSHP